MKLITINNNNKTLRVSIEEINSVCNKCSSKLCCDEDLNIKNGYMRCAKLFYKIEE